MKTLILITALAFGQLALANAPKTGPYVRKVIGAVGSDAPWATCIVYPTVVVKQTGKGAKPSQQIQGIDSAALSQLILAASKAKLDKSGLHVMAAYPQVEILAGVYMAQPSVEDFVLFRDASHRETREGQAAASLLQLAEKFCGDLKAE